MPPPAFGVSSELELFPLMKRTDSVGPYSAPKDFAIWFKTIFKGMKEYLGITNPQPLALAHRQISNCSTNKASKAQGEMLASSQSTEQDGQVHPSIFPTMYVEASTWSLFSPTQSCRVDMREWAVLYSMVWAAVRHKTAKEAPDSAMTRQSRLLAASDTVAEAEG